jgi:predicted outer membrane repeat protein
MTQKLSGKVAGLAAAAAAAAAAAGPWPAQAAEAAPAVHVPCRTTALAGAISGASSGETLTLSTQCNYKLTTGLPIVSQDLTILGHGATLRRSSAAATPAFTILSVDAGTLTVSDLNFSNGDGAISATGTGSLTVHGGTFTGNSAGAGGAISFNTGPANLLVVGARFTRNTATDVGGAIYTSQVNGTATASGDTFIGNTADQAGGALFTFTDMEVSDSSFIANQAADGGAIFNNAEGADGLTGVTISGNSATDDGGGIGTYLAFLFITNSHIFDNHARNDGGGIYQDGPPAKALNLTRTRVQGNTAENGGGIYNLDDDATLIGSPVDGNHAIADGGGLYNVGTPPGNNSSLTATNSAIVRNAAGGTGGGIYDGPGVGFVTLTHSPVLHNKPDNCQPPGSITGCTR